LAAVREYEDVAVKDVMAVSKMIRREGIHVIVVNTNPRFYGRETYGFVVTENIALLTRGTHHAIGQLTTEKDLINNMVDGIREDQRGIVSSEKRAG
jgi:ribosomal protein L36